MAKETNDAPEPMIQVSEKDFKALLSRIGQLETAAKNPSSDAGTLASLVQSISKIAEQSDRGPIKSIPIAKSKQRTPWNPTGKKVRLKLTRPTYMNGHRLHETRMGELEIQLFNQVKPGRYGENGRITVIEKGGDEGSRELQVWIPNKTVPDRLAMARMTADPTPDPVTGKPRAGIIVILERILAEQKSVKLAS